MSVDARPRLLAGRRPKPLAILGYALLLAFVLLYDLPVLWMFLTGFKDNTEIYKFPPTLLPSRFSFGNYAETWRATAWPRYMANTLFVAGAIPVLKILLSAFAGYALTFEFKGAKLIFLAILGTMMIPEETTLVAKYLVVAGLGWINTYWALIVPGMVGAFAVFMFRQFFLTLPSDLRDAAAIDGCGQFRYMISIGLPLAKSTALTVGLLSFLDEWNSTLWPLIVINNDKMRLVQIALKAFSDDRGTTWNQLMAGCTFASLPVIILFLFVQRQFIEGVASSGIKG